VAVHEAVELFAKRLADLFERELILPLLVAQRDEPFVKRGAGLAELLVAALVFEKQPLAFGQRGLLLVGERGFLLDAELLDFEELVERLLRAARAFAE
jgi:hypothetical protein